MRYASLAVPWWILIIYACMSVVTLIFYALDKRAAVRGRRRTRERRLHALGLLGGWPGSIVGMYWLRHKNRKPVFVLITWSIAALHIALIAWLTFL